MTDDNTSKRRQVIPAVSEHYSIAGYPVTDLLRWYMPALLLAFYAINFAPDALTPVGFLLAILTAILTTGVVLAAPDGQPVGEYARAIYRTHTGQEVKLHE